MPTKPRRTAAHLLIPTFSDKNKIDAMVTNIGPPNVKEMTSANGSSLKPKKSAIIANEPVIALNVCSTGLLVL